MNGLTDSDIEDDFGLNDGPTVPAPMPMSQPLTRQSPTTTATKSPFSPLKIVGKVAPIHRFRYGNDGDEPPPMPGQSRDCLCVVD